VYRKRKQTQIKNTPVVGVSKQAAPGPKRMKKRWMPEREGQRRPDNTGKSREIQRGVCQKQKAGKETKEGIGKW